MNRSAFSRSNSGEEIIIPAAETTHDEESMPLVKPPSQVTLQGDLSEATTMTSAVERPPSVASSPSRGLPSEVRKKSQFIFSRWTLSQKYHILAYTYPYTSALKSHLQEDSVAEMDYMSEGSNLSVKGILPPDSTDGDDNIAQNIVPPRLPPDVRSCFGNLNHYSPPALSRRDSSNSDSVFHTPRPYKTPSSSAQKSESSSKSFCTLAQLKHKEDLMMLDNNNKLPAVSSSATTSDKDNNNINSSSSNYNDDEHCPPCLPIFQDPNSCVWYVLYVS